MAKITAPATGYIGATASVLFKYGVGYTDNPHLIEWFRSKGYTVEEDIAMGSPVKQLNAESATEKPELKTTQKKKGGN